MNKQMMIEAMLSDDPEGVRLYRNSPHYKAAVHYMVEHWVPMMLAGARVQADEYDDKIREGVEAMMRMPSFPMAIPVVGIVPVREGE